VDTHYQYDLEIAWCYFYLEDYDAALEYIDKSIKIDAQKPATYYKKGYVYYYK
jgi:tetratricopeptide (TPR) repeat protein